MPELRKESGILRLLYFSLIAEKKNLLFVLELLNNTELSNIYLDIIGPVKDVQYWESCCKKIGRLQNPERVTYHGAIDPEKRIEVISKYHALILPTHGE